MQCSKIENKVTLLDAIVKNGQLLQNKKHILMWLLLGWKDKFVAVFFFLGSRN